MLSKISRTVAGALVGCVVAMRLDHGLAMSGGVPSGHVVFELPLDVGKQAARSKTEQAGAKPAIAQFFLHQDKPVQRLLGRTYAAGGFESDFVAVTRFKFANHACH